MKKFVAAVKGGGVGKLILNPVTGLVEVPDTSVILEEVKRTWADAFPKMRLDPATPQGIIIALRVAEIDETNRKLADHQNQMNAATASGSALQNLGGGRGANVANGSAVSVTYHELLGIDTVYSVPQFQRDYCWTSEEWQDLWLDIMGIYEKRVETHYLGFLVLQSNDKRNIQIIDGQQRLTTISLIILAAMANLKKLVTANFDAANSQARFDSLRKSYIGFQDPVSLLTKTKLHLNRNNDYYYQNYIIELKQPLPESGFSESDHCLRKAFEYFDNQILYLTEKQPDRSLAIVEFIDSFSRQLVFTVMNVGSEVNAYVVFETLNARGVQLSSTDLLKNYLFSVLHNNKRPGGEFDKLDDRWEKITNRIQENKLLEFVRIHWNSRNDFTRKLELYKNIKSKIIEPSSVFGFISDLESDIDSYLALVSPEMSDWKPSIKNYAMILKVFQISQAYPAIIAAKRIMTEDDFEKLMKHLVVITFRLNIIGELSANVLETIYSKLAQHLYSNQNYDFSIVKSILNQVYIPDDQFKITFTNKKFSVEKNRPLIHYVIKSLMDERIDTNPAKIESDSTIEHIVPTNPNDQEWGEFSAEDLENYSNRIGNLLQLEATLNNEASNKEFSFKKTLYAKSKYRFTQEIAQATNWTVQDIINRQETLAEKACQIWRIT